MKTSMSRAANTNCAAYLSVFAFKLRAHHGLNRSIPVNLVDLQGLDNAMFTGWLAG